MMLSDDAPLRANDIHEIWMRVFGIDYPLDDDVVVTEEDIRTACAARDAALLARNRPGA